MPTSNVNELCLYCMNPLPPHAAKCELCGHTVSEQNEPLYLRVRTVLSERYLVGRVLTAGGDSALYSGYDMVAKAPCEIREFLPDTLCERSLEGGLTVISGCEAAFEDYREAFRIHARALARMRDIAAMVPTYDIFEENNTVYTVTEKIGGISLESHLAISGGRLSWEEARPLFIPLLNAFVMIHATGMRHFGITPETLIMAADGKLHIRGFLLPDARKVGSDLKPQLNKGYSAPEQYGFHEHCDAPTDVYALTAVLFRVLTGNPPPDGMTRKNASDLFVPSEVAETLPDYVKTALYKGLQVSPDKRIQTVEKLRDILSATPAVAELRRDKEKNDKDDDETDEPPERRIPGWLIPVSVFVALLLVATLVVFLLFGRGNGDETPSTSATNPTFSTTTTTEADTTRYYTVDKVVGQNYFEIAEESRSGDMTLEISSLKFSDAPKGQILEQSPAAGEKAVADTVIKLVISAGSQELRVPDVSGWKEDHARAYLEALGFTVKKQSVKLTVSSYEKGLVDSTEPAPNTKAPYGMEITLRVSDMELVTDPSLQPTDPETEPIEE